MTSGTDDAQAGGNGQQPARQSNLDNVGAVNFGDIFVMFLSLVFVIAIIYGIYFLMKKGLGKKIAENNMIKIMGSKIIHGNKAIHIIEVGKKIYLIGSSNESLNLISEISEKETVDWIQLAAAEQAQQAPIRFQDIIGKIFKSQPKKQVEIQESVDFMKKQRERLKRMKEE
ncbi:MAG: FliO/MopB family protein [Spirochaetales bacterium]|nr:FliO/MopB family protein [Spirochaetales bacterium]